MSMREKIVDILMAGAIQYDTTGEGPSDIDAADAIIEALPDMIEPLVWDEEDDDFYTAQSILGEFTVYVCREFGFLVQIDGHDDIWVKYPSEDFGFNTPESAKSAANDHHRAQIMAAFGVKL